MEDFDQLLQKNTFCTLSEADQTFSASREGLYQRKIQPTKEQIVKYTSLVFSLVYLINALVDWNRSLIFKSLELVLCALSLYNVEWPMQIFKSNPKGRKPIAKKPVRNNSRQQDTMINRQLMILLVLSEISGYNKEIDFAVWFSRLVPSIVLHMVYFEKFQGFRTTLFLRMLFASSICVTEFFSGGTWGRLVWRSFLMLLTNTSLLNSVKHLNKLVRTSFVRNEAKSKFTNQFYTLMDTIPYPVILFNPKDRDAENKKMDIIYFNLAGDSIVKSKENLSGKDSNDIILGFEDVIDPQDLFQLSEKIDLLVTNVEKRCSFETELSSEFFGGKVGAKKRFDLVLWKVTWMDREIIAALFSDESFRVKKDINRFNSKYQEGLDYLLNKTIDFLDHGITALRTYRWEGADGKKLCDQLTPHLVDLNVAKMLVENIQSFEPRSMQTDLKKFNAKTVITNIVDILSKDIRAKEIGLNLVFSKDFPQQIGTRYSMLKGLIVNLLRYIERRLAKGNILIYCDCEKSNEENEHDESERGNLFVKITFKIDSLREIDLPSADFLNFAPGMTSNPITPATPGNSPLDAMEEKIPIWLNQIKEQLRFTVTNTSEARAGQEMP